jgi:hypothetical protein
VRDRQQLTKFSAQQTRKNIMIHIANLIQRRFPGHSQKVIVLLVLVSAGALAAGMAILFWY